MAAISILIAFLGLGFGLLQFMTRPDIAPALAALPHQEAAAGTSATLSMNAASVGPSVPVASTGGLTSALAEQTRPVHSSVKVLDANYTIAAGDTLVQIALRFNTSVDRVQAFNNLADPRALRIGTKLVVPPPFQ